MSQTDPFAPTPGPTPPTGQPYAPTAPYPAGQLYDPTQPVVSPQPAAPTPTYGTPTQPVAPTPPLYDASAQPSPLDQMSMPGQTPYYGAAEQPYAFGQPYGAPAQPPQPPAKKKTWLILLVGVLVIALAAFGVYWFVLRDKGGSGTGGGETPTPSGPTATPDEAVQGYLKALAAGDAKAALAFAATPPASTTFLTDAVLAASLAIAPITNITVTPSDTPNPPEAYIAASYNIGATGVSTQYDVKLIGDEYLITTITQQLSLASAYISDLGMALNGVPLDGLKLDNIDFFPGAYAFTTTNSLLVISPDHFTVKDANSFTAVNASPLLADDAQPKLAAAAKAALDNCLTEKSLMTTCGFGSTTLPHGATPNNNSATWQITSGSSDFSQTTFSQTYAPADRTYTGAGANIDIKLHVRVRDTRGNQYTGDIELLLVQIDFTDPDNMKVTFAY